MELLTYPNSKYLLEASIDSLHAESLEWLKEIDFWKEEMTFFYKLLHTKNTFAGFPSEELASIDKELIRINSDKLDKIKKEVQDHEQMLTSILKTPTLIGKEKYSERHYNLHLEIFSVSELIRDIKRIVFSFAKKYE
jgi:hypothetical protein